MTNVLATVRRTSVIGESIKLIECEIPFRSIPYLPGAHVDVIFPNKSSNLDRRSYSLVDLGENPNTAFLAVRRVPRSRGGSVYMWSLKPGDKIRLSTARNTFPLSFETKEYAFLAAGIGITPLVGMARAARSAGKKITFHYAVRVSSDLAFLPELQKFLGEDLHTYVDAEGSGLSVINLISTISDSTVLYMCGPIGLMDAAKAAWNARSLPAPNLRFETFAASGHRPNEAFSLRVRETGKIVEVSADESILDALLNSGHDMMYDCRRGECGLCKISIESHNSSVDHRDVFLSEREREHNSVLCSCVSRLGGPSVLTISIDNISHG